MICLPRASLVITTGALRYEIVLLLSHKSRIRQSLALAALRKARLEEGPVGAYNYYGVRFGAKGADALCVEVVHLCEGPFALEVAGRDAGHDAAEEAQPGLGVLREAPVLLRVRRLSHGFGVLALERLQGPDVHRALVAAGGQEACGLVEGDGVNLRAVHASPQLVQHRSGVRIKDADERPLVRGRRQADPILAQRQASELGLVRGDDGALADVVELDADMALADARARQHGGHRLGADGHEALVVGQRVDLIQQLEVREAVHVDLVGQDDDHAVSAQLHRFDFGAKAQLSDAAVLVVIPDHHFVGWIARIGATPDQRKEVTAEQHLHDPDTAAVKHSLEGLFERVHIVDAEAGLRAAGEAAKVLIEAHEEKLRSRLRDAHGRHATKPLQNGPFRRQEEQPA
eukprot:scaffold340_cov256-Pinguiococcus_pyrenoidosus.AAC.55